jgi:membrane protease YdiL (CAAX protease family)
MSEELDLAAFIAGSIVLGILGASAVLWILHLQHSKNNFSNDTNVTAWPIGWINFLIFICAMVVSVAVVQLFAGQLLYLFTSDQGDSIPVETKTVLVESTALDSVEIESSTVSTIKLTPWMAVASVLLLQVPLLATFYGLRRFYPEHFAGALNSQSLTAWQALSQSVPLFIRYLPIIWIASFVWSSFLTLLQQRGIIDEFPPQELIQLFTKGGSPVAIALLVIFAVLLAPIVEEIIFRGGIYRFLKSQTTLLPAQAISAAFFAIMHWNLMSFIPLVVVGILLARVYERSGNIWVPMCFHACFNGFSLIMLLIMSHSSIPTY